MKYSKCTMQIKYARELQPGEEIIRSGLRYRVDRYEQYFGAGSVDWGEYGILYAREITKHNFFTKIIRCCKGTIIAKEEGVDNTERLLKQEPIQTFEFEPFIVLRNI